MASSSELKSHGGFWGHSRGLIFSLDRMEHMKIRLIAAMITLWSGGFCHALEPKEILIVINRDVEGSAPVGEYYCEKRKIPEPNVLRLSLGPLSDAISRTEYERRIVGPLRDKLKETKFFGKIKCLLMTYGVPFKVGPRGQLPGTDAELKRLQEKAKEQIGILEKLKTNGGKSSEAKLAEFELKVTQLYIDRTLGKDTDAALDNELSMVLAEDYELYRWQPNELSTALVADYTKRLMVSRLDGPSIAIAKGLVDKAMEAERDGLGGNAFIDARGIAGDKNPNSYGFYDQSLRDLAAIARERTRLAVVLDNTEKLFGPAECPQTALYCGWYSLGRYVDAFAFVSGAVGYHIASIEGANLRDAESTGWVPSLLKRGLAATLGPVAEPYLQAFPRPHEFFAQLFDGKCLAEAYWRTTPYASWQMMLIGDPLYRPFER